jgi:hypothetical protein
MYFGYAIYVSITKIKIKPTLTPITWEELGITSTTKLQIY